MLAGETSGTRSNMRGHLAFDDEQKRETETTTSSTISNIGSSRTRWGDGRTVIIIGIDPNVFWKGP